MPRIPAMLPAACPAFLAVCLASAAAAPATADLSGLAASRGLCATADNSTGVTLRREGVTLSFTHGNRKMQFNGVAIWMNDVALRDGARWVISRHDAETVVEPLLRAPGALAIPGKGVTVVLDPGHGGTQSGAIAGQTLTEKLVVLDVARRVRRQLRAAGVDVRLTRSRDSDVSLSRRVALAGRWKADVFLSIHANAAANPQAAGMETYVLAGAGFLSTSGNTNEPDPSAGNRHDADNTVLAYCVQKSLVATTGADDRGIRRARFDVLRDAPCPAALVECGFLSNAAEARKLATAEYRETVARGISQGVWDYLRLGRNGGATN
jgi:N-acetylmuramoyl-L-alanine amidase